MLHISANLSNQVFPISWFYMIGKNISKHNNQISLLGILMSSQYCDIIGQTALLLKNGYIWHIRGYFQYFS